MTEGQSMFNLYQNSRHWLTVNSNVLRGLECYFTTYLYKSFNQDYHLVETEYNEATHLYPFWQNYPPDDRGRQPVGDQIPWIEVGESVLGNYLTKRIGCDYLTRDVGLPSGPDLRIAVKSDDIYNITQGLTDSVWLFLDIKSIGPRDDAAHIVASPNQISGDGVWTQIGDGVRNSPMKVTGTRTNSMFYPAIPPLYVLSDGTILPVLSFFIKPKYSMSSTSRFSQELERIQIISVPNGLLLTVSPNYLSSFPRLFFPGKDDKKKPIQKRRARVSFDILKQIDNWRVTRIN